MKELLKNRLALAAMLATLLTVVPLASSVHAQVGEPGVTVTGTLDDDDDDDGDAGLWGLLGLLGLAGLAGLKSARDHDHDRTHTGTTTVR